MKCQRCGQKALISTGSWFNTEQICSTCSKEEEEHPLIEEAKAQEGEACKRGTYNYPGIGLPSELRKKADERSSS